MAVISSDRNWHRSASVWANDDRFRVVFDTIRDGIFISDPDTGRFIQANRAGQLMFGYSMDELIGNDLSLLSAGIPPHANAAALETAIQARAGETRTFEWQCKTKTGAKFWAEISISHALIGKIPCMIASVRDISERKRLDRQLTVALQKTAAASEAKSRFLASMSHELRTPLNAIIGFSALILDEPHGPLGHPRYAEYLGDIHRSGEHLLALINDVLDLSRLDAGKGDLANNEIYLPDLIEDTSRMVAPQAARGDVRLIVDVPSNLPPLRGDARRVRQIFLNLLSNAVKFTPPHGTVAIEAKEAATGLVLRIRDTGIGIAKEDLPVVMERFGQVDSHVSRKHPGTGLGLPLAKQLTELHGGTLTVESEVGAGTCVTVTFPPERIVRVAGKRVA